MSVVKTLLTSDLFPVRYWIKSLVGKLLSSVMRFLEESNSINYEIKREDSHHLKIAHFRTLLMATCERNQNTNFFTTMHYPHFFLKCVFYILFLFLIILRN